MFYRLKCLNLIFNSAQELGNNRRNTCIVFSVIIWACFLSQKSIDVLYYFEINRFTPYRFEGKRKRKKKGVKGGGSIGRTDWVVILTMRREEDISD